MWTSLSLLPWSVAMKAALKHLNWSTCSRISLPSMTRTLLEYKALKNLVFILAATLGAVWEESWFLRGSDSLEALVSSWTIATQLKSKPFKAVYEFWLYLWWGETDLTTGLQSLPNWWIRSSGHVLLGIVSIDLERIISQSTWNVIESKT